jgi:outer membrane protein TolC
MHKLRKSVLALVVGLWSMLSENSTMAAAPDTTRTFTLEDLFVQIVAHHPVARQARLLSERARQEIRLSRGTMDPTLEAKYYHKELNGQNYYTLWDNTLRIPVWFGTDVKAGFEKNSGINVNGENITPPQGLGYIGISLPLGQGLLIDQRRATIRQALLLQNLAEAEQVKAINKLLLEGAKVYWDWTYAYHKLQLHRQGYELAAFRFQATKERVLQGDLAAIDSVEALMETQNREVLVNQSSVEYRNASLALSNFLWREENTPLELSPDIVPSLQGAELSPLPQDSLQQLVSLAENRHPDLLKLRVKAQQLDVERRFLADKLKPKLNLEYNLIGKGVSFDGIGGGNRDYFANNYKLGVSFAYPLFLRNERGKLQLNKLKITENDLDLQQTNREILNGIAAAHNDWLAFETQIRLQQQLVENTERMRNGEQARFETGESSLFLINTREMSLINSRIKLYELLTKYAKNKAVLQWSAGRLSVF